MDNPDTVFEVSESKVPSVKVPREDAKEEIIRLFEQRGELDYVEIMEALGLDLKLVVEICDGLEKERKIEAIG